MYISIKRFFGEWAPSPPQSSGVTDVSTGRIELRYYLEDNTAEVRIHSRVPHHTLTPTPPELPVKFLRRGPIHKV